jgi:hypothetical protein
VACGLDQTAKMLPHPIKERSALHAALAGGRRLRRNFFKARDQDNFKLGRCIAASGAQAIADACFMLCIAP